MVEDEEVDEGDDTVSDGDGVELLFKPRATTYIRPIAKMPIKIKSTVFCTDDIWMIVT